MAGKVIFVDGFGPNSNKSTGQPVVRTSLDILSDAIARKHRRDALRSRELYAIPRIKQEHLGEAIKRGFVTKQEDYEIQIGSTHFEFGRICEMFRYLYPNQLEIYSLYLPNFHVENMKPGRLIKNLWHLADLFGPMMLVIPVSETILPTYIENLEKVAPKMPSKFVFALEIALDSNIKPDESTIHKIKQMFGGTMPHNIKFYLDTTKISEDLTNPQEATQHVIEYMNGLIENLGSIHISNLPPIDVWSPQCAYLDHSRLDWIKLKNSLKSLGYTGYLTFDYIREQDRQLYKSVDFWNNL